MLKHLTQALVLSAAIATPAAALDLNDMTDQERALLREEIRGYLMDNPEIIMEAVNALEQRQAEAQAEADIELVANNADAIFNDGVSYVGGNPEGDVTIVEFLDYKCGYCKRAFGELGKLMAADDNIRFIVKEFPILGEQSLLASRYAIATREVAGDEAYKALHDSLMAFNGEISLPALQRIAATLGIDSAEVEARMEDPAITEELRANRDLAQRLRISGTPSFVLEDELLRGYLPFDQLQMIVEDKRG